MATLNQCSFIGRLGKDPDALKVTAEGKAYIQFSLAVDQGKDQTMWLNVTVWEKQAEVVEKHAAKGALVNVQGKLQLKKYKDKTTQAERLSVEISASNVQVLEKTAERRGTTRLSVTGSVRYSVHSFANFRKQSTLHVCGSIRYR
jgi:single-strand DNA-binding protein